MNNSNNPLPFKLTMRQQEVLRVCQLKTKNEKVGVTYGKQICNV